jgi:hypothetical protein
VTKDMTRVGTADRDRVCARLRELYAQGYLTEDELDWRITRALKAGSGYGLSGALEGTPPAPLHPAVEAASSTRGIVVMLLTGLIGGACLPTYIAMSNVGHSMAPGTAVLMALVVITSLILIGGGIALAVIRARR